MFLDYHNHIICHSHTSDVAPWCMVHGGWWLVRHGGRGRRWWVRVRILFLGLRGRGGKKEPEARKSKLAAE